MALRKRQHMSADCKLVGHLTVEIDPKRRSLVIKARITGGEAEIPLGYCVLFRERTALNCASALSDELVAHMAGLLRREMARLKEATP